MTVTAYLTAASAPGYQVQCTERRISGSTDSPYLTIAATLVRFGEHALFRPDIAFSTLFHGTLYQFIADPHEIRIGTSDDGHPIREAVVHGVSPAAVHGASRSLPIVHTQTTAIMAQDLVEQFIGPVTWNVLNWSIVPYRFAVDGVAPIEAAQLVTDAIGALIVSAPDGSIRIEWDYPGRSDEWHYEVGLRELLAGDLYNVALTRGQFLQANRVVVRDVDVGSATDTLEFVPDPNDGLKGTLRAYPSPWRTNFLARSTRSGIVLGGGVQTLRTETEEIEFIAGRGQTQHPIYSLTSVTWLTTPQSGVTFEQGYPVLSASSGGWGYAQVRYVVRSINFNTTANQAKNAQLLLVELL